MPPKKKTVRGAFSFFELRASLIVTLPSFFCSLLRKNVADRKKKWMMVTMLV